MPFTMRCFNVAAPARARRGENVEETREEFEASTWPRPRGRGEGPRTGWTLFPQLASTWPRPRGRGEPTLMPPFVPVRLGLQRGRARARAESPASRVAWAFEGRCFNVAAPARA